MSDPKSGAKSGVMGGRSKQRVRELVEQGDRLFAKRRPLLSLWQTMAENFCPIRADFTTSRALGSEYASHLMTGRPVLAHRDLGNALSAMLRPRGQAWFHARTGDDVGYATPQRLRADWSGRIPDSMIAALSDARGIRGAAANALASNLEHRVDIPWEAAIAVFREIDVPRWEKTVRDALPNTDLLSPDCFGALVSLSYNRGASFGQAGDRYREMRAIRQHMAACAFDEIPDEIRAMKRLWPNSAGLRKRRDREAALFEKGLRTPSPPSSPQRAPRRPPPSETEAAPRPSTKPAVKSSINWAAIGAFLASVGGLLTDWRVLAVVITGALAGFIIWQRNGKPDIGGWLR